MVTGKQVYQLAPEQLEIRNILKDKNFVELEIWAISNAEPNRNKSCFTIQSMQKGINTFIDKPIMGFFNQSEDFETHNAKVSYDPELDQPYWDNTGGEQILGFIREKDQREIIEKDGLTWIRCTAMVYTQYNYKQIKRLLKDKQKKVSVEVDILESEEKNGIQYIYDFNLSGITILGSKMGVPIREGIEGAHLSVLDMMDNAAINKQKQALVFAYAELNKEEDKELAQQIGTENVLQVNKSQAAVSNTEWGEVDKVAFQQRIVEASNFEAIAKEAFLELREGWEDKDVSKMKYPVMQFSENDEVVYSRGGLASAKGYAEKNNDTEVLAKLKTIYEDLGLNFEEEQVCDCSVFSALYEDEKDPDEGDDKGTDDKKDDEDDKKDEDDAEKAEPQTQAADPVATNCDFEEQCKTLSAKCSDYEQKCSEYEQKCADYEARCAEYEEKCTHYEEQLASCNSNLEAAQKNLEAVNKELQEYKQKDKERVQAEQTTHINTLAQKMGLSEEDIKGVLAKCEASAFASMEDIDKEMAYMSWKKNYSEAAQQTNKKTEEFSVNIVDEPTNVKSREKLNVGERLKRNLEKQ